MVPATLKNKLGRVLAPIVSVLDSHPEIPGSNPAGGPQFFSELLTAHVPEAGYALEKAPGDVNEYTCTFY